MCGRYSNTRFGRFNVAPTETVVAAVQDEGGRRLAGLRWGLVPAWAEDSKPRFQMINARSETVMERPAYRGLVEQAAGRCLVLADGWYEWQGPEDPRQPRRPVHFSLPGRAPFCFAGLWAASTSSCTILTCAANELARPIHDRMPVVLTDPARWDAWLDPAHDGRDVSELLVPLPSGDLCMRPANPVVNTAGHDGPGCLEPELSLL